MQIYEFVTPTKTEESAHLKWMSAGSVRNIMLCT